MSDFLPCPHCGGSVDDEAIEPHSHAMSFGGVKMPDHTGSHHVECFACGSGMISETRDEVLALWNRRSTSDELTRLTAENQSLRDQFASAREAAIRECAGVCDDRAMNMFAGSSRATVLIMAKELLALLPPEQS